MNDGEFKGYVTARLESNDQEHKEIKRDLKEIKEIVTGIRISSAKGGILGGAITAGLAFVGLWIKSQIGK